MVDTKLTDLTELGEAVADTDVIYGVNVSSGASAKILASRIKTYTSNSPTLVTPALGTPSSGTLTNCTGLPVGGISATGTPDNTTYLRGDGSWQTVSAGATPGGSDTQVQFNDGGSSLGGDAGLTYNKTSNDLTITGGGLVVTGNISAAAWTTNGIRFRGVAGTLTDTSSSGTVAAAYTNAYGGNTIAASSSTTFTNYYTTFITEPTAGTNVTFTNRHALGLSGSLAFSGDVVLTRDAANVLAQRRSTNAQTFRVYNTYTDASNYERGFTRWNSNVFEVGTEAAGTGTNRALSLISATGVTSIDTIALTANGSASSPGMGRGTSGVYFSGANGQVYVTVSGSYLCGFLSGPPQTLSIRQAAVIGFESAGAASAVDTLIHRVGAGILGVRAGATTTGGALSFIEQTAPSAPATNGVYIYAEDNGSGKTRLMALFPTGAAQQIAIEP